MPDVRIDGEPLPRGAGISLHHGRYGSVGFWTRRDEVMTGVYVTVDAARLHDGARVTVDGDLVHVEGVAERLRCQRPR
jgi:hypothetical protein